MSTRTKRTLQKAASVATSAATILWLSGISMLAPVMAVTYADGTLLKGSAPTIWVVNNNLKVEIRSAEVFNNSGYNWNAIKTVSDATLNSVPTADLIKTATNPDVYKLEKNFKRKLASIEIFNSYNLDWNKISVVSQPVMDSFSYAPIFQHGVDLYWRDANNVLHYFPTMELFTANGYNVRDLIVINDAEFGSFAIGENISSAPPPTTGILTVALSSDTPASATLANDTSNGSAIADLAHFVFTNGSGSEVKVTQLKLKRLGVSDDATLGNIYLFDGNNRLTDEGTLSSGIVSFNDAAGIFTIPANSSKIIAVRADIAPSSSGKTVGFSIQSATDIVSTAATVSGSFPINGNLMSITDSSSVATAALSSSTATPSADATVDAQNDFTVWQNTLTVNNQDVKLYLIRFTQLGSIGVNDLTNLRLRIQGADVATGQLVVGKTGQDLIFDLSSNPYLIQKGNSRQITVVGDIIGGTSKTIKFGLEKTADIIIKDQAYGNYTKVTGTIPNRTGSQTVATGTITMTKRIDSPSGNITKGQTNVSLAKFDVKANGEEIKINTLKVQAYMSATSSVTAYVRNVSLFLDGVQVGNTTNLAVTANSSDNSTYTQYNIYQKIPAGTTKVLEVKGDVYTCSSSACTSNVAANNDKIQIKILGSSSEDNAQGMTSAALIDAPGSTVSANELTVGTGSLTVAKNTAYSDQTVSAGSEIKIGSYNLQASAFDTINITNFTVGINNDGNIPNSKWSNLYVKYGGNQTSAKGTVASSNSFSVNTSLSPNASMQVDIYATLDSSVTSGSASTTLAVTATKATDGSDASVAAVTGQTITVASASRSVNIDTVIPSDIIVGGTQNVNIMDVRFRSLNAPSSIDQMRLAYGTTTDANVNAITSCKINYPTQSGTAETAYLPFIQSGTNYFATFTGLTMYLPANTDETVKVYCNFNNVGSGFAETGDYPSVTLYDYRVASGGTQTTEVPYLTSQVMVLRKTKPTFTAVSLPSTYLAAGSAVEIARFTITPDPAGAVGWKKLVFNFTKSSNPTLGDVSLYNVGTGLAVSGSVATTSSAITFTATNEEIVGTATTYRLVASIGGSITTGDFFTTYIQNANSTDTAPTTAASSDASLSDASVLWTDRSNANHSLTTADWTNDWLVKNIGSAYGWTLTR